MTAPTRKDPFGAKITFNTGSGTAALYKLSKLEDLGLGKVSALPFSIRVLLEALLTRWYRSIWSSTTRCKSIISARPTRSI
jgi:hypothetical protein